MPKIKISNGVVYYKTHPLFFGVKKIDKKLATENLLLLKNFFESHNVSFGLIAGTLLGAVRENDFISHDEDIDLFILDEQKNKVLNLLPDLIKEGFKVARYDRRGLLSIIRNGEYIDLYFFSQLCNQIRNCCGWCVPEDFLCRTTTIKFKGNDFIVPYNYEGFLVYEYGNNWRTPIKWVDFEIPKWKRKLNEWKEKIKEILPDFLFYPIVKKKERRMLKKYESKIEIYNTMYNTSLKLPTKI